MGMYTQLDIAVNLRSDTPKMDSYYFDGHTDSSIHLRW